LSLPDGMRRSSVWDDRGAIRADRRKSRTFPIAESLGALIYGNQGTAANLQAILEDAFEMERKGRYAGKAGCIALLYRHGLTHTDEMHGLVYGGTTVTWQMTIIDQTNHLRLRKTEKGVYCIQFDTTAFYGDLVAVCRTASEKNWSGRAMRRYNSWFTYCLDRRSGTRRRTTANEKAVIREIGNFPR
jgi:hypothetical protein